MTLVTVAIIILWISTDSLDQNLGVILLIIGIGWMLVASFFLYRLLVSTFSSVIVWNTGFIPVEDDLSFV